MDEKEKGKILYFSFFLSFLKTAEMIAEKEQRLQFYENILYFMFFDREPQGDPMQLALFEAIRPVLQNSKDKIEAGRKGGKAKQTASKTKQSESKAKQTASTLKQSESETGKEKEKGIKDKGIRDKGVKDQGIRDKGAEDKGAEDKGLKDRYYPNDEELDEAFRGYVEFRKEIKKPMTNRAVDLAIKNLNDLSGGDNSKAIQILNQSVVNGWQGLFPLKNTDNREGRQTPPKEPTFLDLARGATEDSKTVSFMDLVKEVKA